MFLDTLCCLNTAEPNGLLVEMTQAQAGVGIGLDMISLHRIAASYHARAIANAERSQHPRATGYAYFGRGIQRHFFLGDLERAAGDFERAVESYRQVGDVRGSGAATSCWLHGLCLRGEFEQWESMSQALTKLGADTGDQQVYGWRLGHLTHVRLLRGAAVDDVIRELDATLSIFQAIPDHASMALSKAIVSLCYLAQGDLSTALHVAMLTLSLIGERHIRGPFVPYVIGLLADCASVALSGVRGGINMKRGDEATIQSIDRMLSGWGTSTREAKVAMYRWRGVRAWANAKEPRARQWWQRSLEGAKAMGANP